MPVFNTDFLGWLFVKHVIKHHLPVCWIQKWTTYHYNNICDVDRDDADAEWDGLQYDQSNLAIKGIVAIGAMSKMSSAAGHVADADKYSVCIDPPYWFYSEIDPLAG